VLLDDAHGYRETKARPLAKRLGREKRFENARQHVWRDAWAVIDYLDDEAVALWMTVDPHGPWATGAGRGLRAVHHEVRDHLLDRGPVHVDAIGIGDVDFERDSKLRGLWPQRSADLIEEAAG
jgi:hypothetical protein